MPYFEPAIGIYTVVFYAREPIAFWRCGKETLTRYVAFKPLPIMLNFGVPTALCNDDPAVFTNHGLSYDFFQLFNTTEAYDLRSLYQLTVQSIEHSFMSPQQKESNLRFHNFYWKQFNETVVQKLKETGI